MAISSGQTTGVLAELPRRAAEFRLSNGMKFVVVERHQVPIVAVHFRVGAGVADEPPGKSGISLLIERTFLHGSETLGSRNPGKERTLLQAVERHMDEWSAEMSRGEKANPLLAQDPEIRARILIDQAAAWSNEKPFQAALTSNGVLAFRLAAGTSATDLSITAPSNRMEVWLRMLGDWLRNPSTRGFYLERNTLRDQFSRHHERPEIRAREELLKSAFPQDPPPRLSPHPDEVYRLRPRDIESFLSVRWRPGNLAVAVVGDITPEAAKRLAETHFSTVATGPPGPGKRREAVRLTESRRIRADLTSPPLVAIGWRRPGREHSDSAAFVLLAALLDSSEGHLRTSLGGTVARIRVDPGLPDDRSDCLFVLEAEPAAGRTFDDAENVLNKALDELRSKPVNEQDLRRVKSALRMQLAAGADSYADLASLLARAVLEYGSVPALAEVLQRIEAVTPADLQRVAGEYLARQSAWIVHAGTPGLQWEQP
jgi:predicted Zn-dependent peptidase